MPRVQLPATTPKRRAWNKGQIIGQKRPLLPKQVWAIRARLEMAGYLRDLALFNVAIDSKLRGCDLVKRRCFAHCACAVGNDDGLFRCSQDGGSNRCSISIVKMQAVFQHEKLNDRKWQRLIRSNSGIWVAPSGANAKPSARAS